MSKLFTDKGLKKLLGNAAYKKIKDIFDYNNNLEAEFEGTTLDITAVVDEHGNRAYIVRNDSREVCPVGYSLVRDDFTDKFLGVLEGLEGIQIGEDDEIVITRITNYYGIIYDCVTNKGKHFSVNIENVK